ncbi:monocarboxylate transporter 12-B-like isoform X1 [Octopus sinensis]|uniref:Monocarboxylate transporter 12-B-like isoform X1 n=1 Tax=Octopus sinensis TaxID=2607531 RepID=A0A6P7TGK5_9MOLL|nr:monocarboxylate transporter 12-B-like isoform X1 [Octopus sinensis]XP_036368918.1 monocarboxylate transporter 12-B-like isoform X1 [Octopus sinensis]
METSMSNTQDVDSTEPPEDPVDDEVEAKLSLYERSAEVSETVQAKSIGKFCCSSKTCAASIVYLSLFYNVFVCSGVPISLGVMYPELKASFSSTNAEAATIVSLAMGLLTSGGIIGGFLCNKIGARKTIAMGSILSFSGAFASYFAESILTLMFTLGVFVGIGNAVVYIPSMVVVSEKFDNHASMLTMILTAGRPAGVLLFPIIINFLMEIYFWQGTLLIISGFLLNIVLFGLLATSPILIPSSDVQNTDVQKKTWNFSVLKNTKYVLTMLSLSIMNSTLSAVVVIMIDFFMERGYSKGKAVFLLSAQSFAALLARGLTAGMSFLPSKCRPPEIFLLFISGIVSSTILFSLPFINNFTVLCIILIISALFVGIRNSVVPTLCLNILGKEHYAMALGFSQTFIGLASIVMGSLGGYIRDVTKSYDTTFMAFAGWTFFSTLILSTIYIFLYSNLFKAPKEKKTVCNDFILVEPECQFPQTL